MIIDHTHPEYIELRKATGKGKYNGCYYYSREIVKNIIPNVKTWRGWNTVGKDIEGMQDHMIVFLHDNSTPWHYEWLHKYKDLVLVCSSKYTALSVAYSGHVVMLPMSIDTKYVKQFKAKRKSRDICFVGNVWVKDNMTDPDSVFIPGNTDFLSGMGRVHLLREVAKYKKCIAIDRCAQEAMVLGCKVTRPEMRYGCDYVKGGVLDNRDAAKILQAELDKIDNKEVNERLQGDAH